jgi:hypothetical protein
MHENNNQSKRRLLIRFFFIFLFNLQINKGPDFTPEQIRRLQEEAAADNIHVNIPGVC